MVEDQKIDRRSTGLVTRPIQETKHCRGWHGPTKVEERWGQSWVDGYSFELLDLLTLGWGKFAGNSISSFVYWFIWGTYWRDIYFLVTRSLTPWSVSELKYPMGIIVVCGEWLFTLWGILSLSYGKYSCPPSFTSETGRFGVCLCVFKRNVKTKSS